MDNSKVFKSLARMCTKEGRQALCVSTTGDKETERCGANLRGFLAVELSTRGVSGSRKEFAMAVMLRNALLSKMREVGLMLRDRGEGRRAYDLGRTARV